jgi:hypothetical protein
MKASDIQKKILAETGIKTSVKKNTGSMKGYITIRPLFQNGTYPSFPFDWVRKLKEDLKKYDTTSHPVFCSTSGIDVYQLEDERIMMKKEAKPKEISQMKDGKGWGSKNSQVRLDKAVSRNAKKLRNGTTARYI